MQAVLVAHRIDAEGRAQQQAAIRIRATNAVRGRPAGKRPFEKGGTLTGVSSRG